MKLHVSVIERIVHLYETYGGHRDEKRLRNVVAELDLSEYTRQSGEKILVLTEQLDQEREQQQTVRR